MNISVNYQWLSVCLCIVVAGVIFEEPSPLSESCQNPGSTEIQKRRYQPVVFWKVRWVWTSKPKLINHPELKIISSLLIYIPWEKYQARGDVWSRLGWHVVVRLRQVPVRSYCSAVFPQQRTTKWQLPWCSGTICLVNPAILLLPEYDRFYLISPRK